MASSPLGRHPAFPSKSLMVHSPPLAGVSLGGPVALCAPHTSSHSPWSVLGGDVVSWLYGVWKGICAPSRWVWAVGECLQEYLWAP